MNTKMARSWVGFALICINENHSLGEWFKKSLLAIM